MDNAFKSPAILSFCPGVLGLERGIERAIGTLRVVAYVEIQSWIIENLLVGMESGELASTPIWTDATTFDPSPFRDRIHGIIGGYPCQPFSLAGKRKGENDERHLWPFIRNAVAAIKPVWCFFENVDDHLTMGFDTVYKDLRALGYRVEANVFSAEEIGAPHERQRLFILAVLGNAGGQGLEKRRKQPACKKLPPTERASNPFPRGQGYEQFHWEEPRLIESRMVRTIDGYNIREDLLRAIGNSVVEQTAELAFRTLADTLKLHIE